MASADILAEICAKKRDYTNLQKQQLPMAELERAAQAAAPARGFCKAVHSRVAARETAIIAEIKKSSPSKGLIRADFDPPSIAREYEAGGAACLSVLTEYDYFGGRDEYISRAKGSCSLPVLRKDFIMDEYQTVQSRAIGADALLLIVAALDDATLRRLLTLALDIGLDALIEVHDRAEMDRAAEAISTIRSAEKERILLGINNRNLRTLEIDISTTIQLAPHAPPGITIVCESGIYTRAEVEHVQREAGVFSFLIGHSLMEQEDITTALRELL